MKHPRLLLTRLGFAFFVLGRFLLGPSRLFLGQRQDEFPLRGSHGRHAEPGLLQRLHVLEWPSRSRLGFQVIERDHAGEFVSELDVHHIPLGVVLGGFFVIVRIRGI